MSNIFVNLPVPAANGNGASVDVTAMGATKTIIVGGSFLATVTIEYSNDPGALHWAPVANSSFVNSPGRVTVQLAAHWVRAVTSGYKSGSANADVGAAYSPASFVQLTAAPANIATLPPFKTVMVTGACNVEVSEDGISYSQAFSFQAPGAQSAVVIGQFARVTNGVICWMGGVDPGVSAGASVSLAAGVFVPDSIGVKVDVTSQSGQFVAPGAYLGAGQYTIDMVPIPGVTSADQIIPTLMGVGSVAPIIGVAQVAFSVDHAVIAIAVFDNTAAPVTDPFFLHVAILTP